MVGENTVVQTEVDRNYEFFRSRVDDLRKVHKGQFVLIRHQGFVDFFDDGYAAFKQGQDRFPDGLFSVQEVDDHVIDLGILSRV